MTTNLSPANAALSTNVLRDIKGPVEISSGWTWVWWVLAILALTGLIAWVIWLLKRKKLEAPATPPVPAHIRARQKLQEALAFIAKPKPFCTVVSDTIRSYLEERFNFHAPDRTTEEFLHELGSTNLLLPDQKESLGDFLKRCDLVKFARYEPGEPELRELHGSALRLIDETEPLEEKAGGEKRESGNAEPPPYPAANRNT